MHPTPLDVEYMRRLVAELPKWRCDSFEICAECHTLLGGMDGLVLYEDYPAVAASLDRDGILANRAKFKEILELAHSAGKPVYYWHREVTVWPEIMKEVPELLDGNGEFNLLGDEFEKLLRYKLSKTFEALPELDGIVLTLTEADFSAIHNSTPDVYPPEKVVDKIVRIFADEHQKRGKRFILRSFGSIAKDYEDILAGAKLAAKDYSFEIETKITPYDFDPFLPDNPFLKSVAPNLTMGAECDVEGEFLGFGNLPSENVENIVRFVRHGQRQGVNRYTIRLDRMGNNIFDTYPINLYAYQEAILRPDATAEEIRLEYAAKHYPPSCAEELNRLGKLGFSLVEKLLFIDHIVMFHQNPIAADLKWIKAGGFFALFAPKGTSLKPLMGIWPMLPQDTIGRDAIIAEKQKALEIAKEGMAIVEKLKGQLAPEEYERLARLWGNGICEATALLEFVKVVAAYFKDMDDNDGNAPTLLNALHEMADKLNLTFDENAKIDVTFNNGMDHHVFKVHKGDFRARFESAVMGASLLVYEEFKGEFKAKHELLAKCPNAIDYVVVGGLSQDWRCVRNMHASHALLLDGRPARFIGNPVFPNGFVTIALNNNSSKQATRLYMSGTGKCRVNGKDVTLSEDGIEIDANVESGKEIKLTFTKAPTKEYPALRTVALI